MTPAPVDDGNPDDSDLDKSDLDDHVYAQLLHFRRELRAFLRWSEDAAGESGLTPAVHQLLLAVRASERDGGPTIGDVAEALGVRHHSAVELAARAEQSGLVIRSRGTTDHREVRLRSTALGQEKLAQLTRLHRPRIAALAAVLSEVAER